MNFDSFDSTTQDLMDKIEDFIKNNDHPNINISINSNDYDHISLKIPYDDYFDSEGFLETIENQNQSKYYVITTFNDDLGEPELKKYFIRYNGLNDFLKLITDQNSEETIISIISTEE